DAEQQPLDGGRNEASDAPQAGPAPRPATRMGGGQRRQSAIVCYLTAGSFGTKGGASRGCRQRRAPHRLRVILPALPRGRERIRRLRPVASAKKRPSQPRRIDSLAGAVRHIAQVRQRVFLRTLV